MRVRIHRGAAQIGGSCVEVQADDGHRIVLDVGRPLDAGFDEDVPLPDVPGLRTPDSSFLGVVVSHPHLDHYGLIEQRHAGVPVAMGEQAAAVVEAARFFSPATPVVRVTQRLAHREAFRWGPFTIEPRLNDHSAFDAYSLLIEADGRRVFYTGDIRGHGRKASLFEELCADPPANVNAMLLEGTHVRLETEQIAAGVCVTEAEVEDRLVEMCANTDGMVVVCGSAQNLDRVVSVHRAALRASRATVLDLYGATIAAAARPSIPQPGHRGLRVYVPNRQRILVKRAQEFDRVERIRPFRVFSEELAAEPGQFLLHVPSSTVPELLRAGAVNRSGLVVWSLWEGYLDAPSGQTFTASLSAAGVPLTSAHTSGHASIADLQRLVASVAPERVVPIHTEAPHRYATLFPNVVQRHDGEWWQV